MGLVNEVKCRRCKRQATENKLQPEQCSDCSTLVCKKCKARWYSQNNDIIVCLDCYQIRVENNRLTSQSECDQLESMIKVLNEELRLRMEQISKLHKCCHETAYLLTSNFSSNTIPALTPLTDISIDSLIKKTNDGLSQINNELTSSKKINEYDQDCILEIQKELDQKKEELLAVVKLAKKGSTAIAEKNSLTIKNAELKESLYASEIKNQAMNKRFLDITNNKVNKLLEQDKAPQFWNDPLSLFSPKQYLSISLYT